MYLSQINYQQRSLKKDNNVNFGAKFKMFGCTKDISIEFRQKCIEKAKQIGTDKDTIHLNLFEPNLGANGVLAACRNIYATAIINGKKVFVDYMNLTPDGSENIGYCSKKKFDSISLTQEAIMKYLDSLLRLTNPKAALMSKIIIKMQNFDPKQLECLLEYANSIE